MSQNLVVHMREAFEEYVPNTGRWAESKAAGDIVRLEGNAVAASYLTISKSPFTAGTETSITSVSPFEMPYELAVGAHLSQRTLGQEFSIEVVDTENRLLTCPELAIASVSQSTTTLTVTTALPHRLTPGSAIGIYGVPDSRLNYAALVVASIPSATQFTCTAGPGNTIPSVTAGPFTAGFVYERTRLGRAKNGVSMIFENATATNAALYARSESGDVLPSGTAIGNHAVSVSSTASVQAINAAATYAFVPTTEYRIVSQSDRIQWADAGIDTTAQLTSRLVRTQVVPNPTKEYKLRFRAANTKGLTIPVAQIVSVAKTGTTTATVTTDVPHGLTITDFVNAYGVRDTTNFANLAVATAVASVPTATTFTLVWGSAVTATSFGGYISRVNGGQAQQGAIAQVVQSVVAASGVITLTGSAAWSGFVIGDFVDLIGCRDNATGAPMNMDGAWRVRNIVTTALELEPIDATVTPSVGTLVSTNCGGAIIKRTCLRLSFVRVFDYERYRVEMLARPTGDMSAAAPVTVQNAIATTLSSGTVTTVSALTGGGVAEDAAAGTNPVIGGGVVRSARAPVTLIAGDAARNTMTTEGSQTIQAGAAVPLIDLASAARTTTGNSGAISTPTGGAIGFVVAVTAASGTTPTMDLTLEESFDNGVTFMPIYMMPRFTAAATISVPPLAIGGIRRWSWVIAGTTPSFTFSITTSTGNSNAPIVRQLFDRTAGVLNGTNANSTTALDVTGCKAIQTFISLTSAAVYATYQLQLSVDGALFANVGSTVTVSTTTTITTAVPAGLGATKARVIVTSGGTTQVGNYVAIYATS